jgi:hypothetical protein
MFAYEFMKKSLESISRPYDRIAANSKLDNFSKVLIGKKTKQNTFRKDLEASPKSEIDFAKIRSTLDRNLVSNKENLLDADNTIRDAVEAVVDSSTLNLKGTDKEGLIEGLRFSVANLLQDLINTGEEKTHSTLEALELITNNSSESLSIAVSNNQISSCELEILGSQLHQLHLKVSSDMIDIESPSSDLYEWIQVMREASPKVNFDRQILLETIKSQIQVIAFTTQTLFSNVIKVNDLGLPYHPLEAELLSIALSNNNSSPEIEKYTPRHPLGAVEFYKKHYGKYIDSGVIFQDYLGKIDRRLLTILRKAIQENNLNAEQLPPKSKRLKEVRLSANKGQTRTAWRATNLARTPTN